MVNLELVQAQIDAGKANIKLMKLQSSIQIQDMQARVDKLEADLAADAPAPAPSEPAPEST